ncbi:MBL fold metallo-hydrolase [Kibdelosporangium aridum]|uniref:Ribonuclease BN, tRNA processing enzyme n=1 Tax=Kibdelosporangium aridum TaxID=2030 RepID=A0A1W2EY49_KIBAR|nr:MBL fold metallo-hydrolase [Kibdelosporangium aridum]SMD14625.1 Ribonuclease BN, tRNA processing enzyme [Kibdelosporangium aridum]
MSTTTPAMTLTVLGAATPFPKPDEPCSGFLLQADGTSIWIDAGSGTLAELQRHVPLAAVDAIWISHLHPDHWADLLAAWNAYANDDALPRPTVFGPPGWTHRLDSALGQHGAAAKVFEVVELGDRLKTMVGPIELQAFAMHHSVPTFGVRAEASGRVMAYSADTGPCKALIELGQGADVLVMEAGASEPSEFHCTPEEVARTVGNAARVLLTHLAPGLETDVAVARFQAVSPVLVDVASVGFQLTL